MAYRSSWLSKTLALFLSVWITVMNVSGRAEETYFRKGNASLNSNQIDQALTEFHSAEVNRQISGQLFNNIGYAYFLKGDLVNAATYYHKALKLNPELAVTYNNLGVVFHRKNDYKKAVTYYKRALKLQPKYAKAAYNLAVAYFRMHRYIRAARQYFIAKRINPTYGEKRFQKEKLIGSVKEELKSDPQNDDLKRALQFLQNKSP